MKKKTDYSFLLALVVTPVFIYLYFLKWRTTVIYGDDISIFLYESGAHSLSDKINIDVSFQKYRPIHGLAIQLLITLFQKKLEYYYLFNICIQTINTFLFARILHLFLRSRWLSLGFSLIIGVSRFSFFNISQLFNGGALEGLAITFFLLSLFFILKVLKEDGLTPQDKQRGIISSILFANASMYTHERYIVLFPFLILVIFGFPGLRVLSKKLRIALALMAFASIVLNVVIKKCLFSIPFLVGTGGSSIGFSFSTILSFFADAILSIFQINTGPAYLAGAPFSSLPLFDQVLALLLAAGCLSVAVIYLVRVRKMFVRKEKSQLPHFYILILLGILFGLLLAPAVVSFRLEHRWLQASAGIFILMLVIMVSDWQLKNNYIRGSLLFLFVLLFLWTDYNYLDKGGSNLYMVYSHKLASDFKEAMDKGIIRSDTRKLYIWEKRRDANTESAIRWDLGNGGLFEYYQGRPKKIIYIDSLYERSYPFPFTQFVHFNETTDQILFLNNNVNDISGYFRKDSLKYFSRTKIDELIANNQLQYNPSNLLITADDLDKFTAPGFYNNEDGIVWTNGNASIALGVDYTVKDSLEIVLSTYLPAICRNINPRIVLVDNQNKEYRTFSLKREEDTFRYKFYFTQFTTVQTVKILSDTINSAPDPRVLSFPFVSLELKN